MTSFSNSTSDNILYSSGTKAHLRYGEVFSITIVMFWMALVWVCIPCVCILIQKQKEFGEANDEEIAMSLLKENDEAEVWFLEVVCFDFFYWFNLINTHYFWRKRMKKSFIDNHLLTRGDQISTISSLTNILWPSCFCQRINEYDDDNPHAIIRILIITLNPKVYEVKFELHYRKM